MVTDMSDSIQRKYTDMFDPEKKSRFGSDVIYTNNLIGFHVKYLLYDLRRGEKECRVLVRREVLDSRRLL